MNKRVFGLDVMRCIAILTVVYGHIFFILPTGINPLSKLVLLQFIDGVDIFFTLSGFLIGTIILKKINEGKGIKVLLSFWRDRWLRTLPAYFFVLAVIICLGVRFTGLDYFLPYLFFLQNLHTGKILFGESWSLTIEEWFYLCTPVLFFILSRFGNKKALQLVAITGVILLGNAVRIYKIHHIPMSTALDFNFAIRETLPARMDAIMYGVLGAYLSYYRYAFWEQYKNLLFYAGISGFTLLHFAPVLLSQSMGMVISYLYFPLEGIFTMMVLPKAASVRVGKGWISKLITHISKTSYSIYLVHTTLFVFLVQSFLPKKIMIQLPAYLLWAFGASYILYATVERGGLRIREKIRRRQEMKAAAKEKQGSIELVPSVSSQAIMNNKKS